MKRKPKMIIDPDWAESEEGRRYYESKKQDVMFVIRQNRDCPEDYFPEDYNKALPDDGGWITLLMTVSVSNGVDNIEVPHLSMWFAKPTQAQNGNIMGFHPYKAIIQTPQGEVHVWPHEYAVISEIGAYLDFADETGSQGIKINFMHESGSFDTAKLFYIMSRGISRPDAQRMLLPELKDPHFCYFTMAQEIQYTFGEGFGMPHLLDVNHERRAESRRARKANA